MADAEVTKPAMTAESVLADFGKAISAGTDKAKIWGKEVKAALDKAATLSPEEGKKVLESLQKLTEEYYARLSSRAKLFTDSTIGATKAVLEDPVLHENIDIIRKELAALQKDTQDAFNKFADKAGPDLKDAAQKAKAAVAEAASGAKEHFSKLSAAIQESASKVGVKLTKALEEFSYEFGGVKRPFFKAVPHWISKNPIKSAGAVGAAVVAGIALSGGKNAEKEMERRGAEQEAAPAR